MKIIDLPNGGCILTNQDVLEFERLEPRARVIRIVRDEVIEPVNTDKYQYDERCI